VEESSPVTTQYFSNGMMVFPLKQVHRNQVREGTGQGVYVLRCSPPKNILNVPLYVNYTKTCMVVRNEDEDDEDDGDDDMMRMTHSSWMTPAVEIGDDNGG
jgi:hypothetical protein